MTGTDEAPGAGSTPSLALNDAATRGDIAAAKEAIAAGADIHYNRDVALRSAARTSNLAMMTYLVKEAGADVHALKDEALRMAAKGGKVDVVNTLLTLGADPDAMDGDPLIQASMKGQEGVVKALLAHKANPHFSEDQALRMAAYNGHLDIVRALAQNKADLFSMRGSAAQLASSEKFGHIVEYLAEQMDAERKTFLFELSLPTATKEFLRRPYRDTGEPAFIRAVKMNCLLETVQRMKETDDTITSADLHGLKDRQQRPLGLLAAEYGRLPPLFDVALWKGTIEDVQDAWNKIPETLRKSSGMTEEDFSGIVAGFNQRALKEKAGKFKLKF